MADWDHGSRPFNCCRAATSGEKKCPRYWVMNAGCPPGSPMGFLENGVLLKFNFGLSQSLNANIWTFVKVPGFPDPVLFCRVTKANADTDATVHASVFVFGDGGLQGEEDLDIEDPMPWAIHFPYPNDEMPGGGDPDWLPDGFHVDGFETIEGALSEWPDLDTEEVNP